KGYLELPRVEPECPKDRQPNQKTKQSKWTVATQPDPDPKTQHRNPENRKGIKTKICPNLPPFCHSGQADHSRLIAPQSTRVPHERKMDGGCQQCKPDGQSPFNSANHFAPP